MEKKPKQTMVGKYSANFLVLFRIFGSNNVTGGGGGYSPSMGMNAATSKKRQKKSSTTNSVIDLMDT